MCNMKNKCAHNYWCVRHAKFHCIMSTLNKLFTNKFERGKTGKEPKSRVIISYLQKLTKFRGFYEQKINQTLIKNGLLWIIRV